mmetsp:Transcript_8113/g.14219  ORF Transcript_8113/g.14219 Transcript_8113/m.14219 type:complete len:143 (-) Transcript_8113:150-578(-)|eukprot:CAMPEP_0183706826 /NCGR_PEP_ID=MMETSP0737-20130205/3564_1 /TAXON_ID=385413 /ORGANISM="Thalassiosira miniscula, Strain CCMP1093" /LENGTH=142 /DNA_ID=CAMNT_0025934345 /DNA_START=207 /DNA_END=635 /DNA_ORIENTATION=+
MKTKRRISDDDESFFSRMLENESRSSNTNSPRQIFFLAIVSAIIVFSYNRIILDVWIQMDAPHNLSSSTQQRRYLRDGSISSNDSPSIDQIKTFPNNLEYHTQLSQEAGNGPYFQEIRNEPHFQEMRNENTLFASGEELPLG